MQWGEGVSLLGVWGRSVPGSGSSQCRGPGAGVLVCSRSSQEALVAGTREGGEMWERRLERWEADSAMGKTWLLFSLQGVERVSDRKAKLYSVVTCL